MVTIANHLINTKKSADQSHELLILLQTKKNIYLEKEFQAEYIHAL